MKLKSKGFNPYNDNLKITVNIDQDAQQKLYDLVNDGSVPFTNDKMQVGATIIDLELVMLLPLLVDVNFLQFN